MKNRRRFLQRLGGLAALLALPGAGRHALAATKGAVMAPSGDQGGTFVHSVYFWLVDETMPTRGKFVTEVLKYLKEIDVIRTRHLGRAAGTEREVVDNSYSYCMILTFDSREDHDHYQAHPAHQQFIENASSLWTRVQVYDSVRCEM
ncbi:MAG: Dabb family protein [Bacteroidales bacterium]